MIDVDLTLTVRDRRRRFDLAAKFSTDAPVAALYGPSGSGKTLTLQAIAGLLRPGAGHIRINGRVLYDAASGVNVSPPQRCIGYLFQDYALFPHLSVRENIAFGLTNWRRRSLPAADRDHVQALLDSFDLAPLAGSRPHTLSGGQKQRVALARALACRPQILLLDEPFASLNPMLRQSLRKELADVRRQWGIPALMITHDIEDVLELADIAFVYDNGQVVREVNLSDATSRERGIRELSGGVALEEPPLRQRLRQLLSGLARG